MSVTIREADRARDAETVWQILRPAVEAGDTFCADPRGGKAGALAYFWPDTARVWIAEADGVALGCAYLRANQTGNGAHVCNAGYCTSHAAQGRGVARALLEHSLAEARRQGFRAMQYNFVVETNTRAIETWRRAGFDVVGRLPGAFHHPERGYVDALVMYRSLV
ncbi:Acetyltransferase (GNAT) family protein [Cribrihabitans marinus]|uniref:Acetyltransferase (GNAT) family protein n=1 Tax=Cribrihabitans marinus TaxID=1227549 RepID=A0A1H7BZW3_9RHOB|nr:GNAT family N-acetyltransferase [Cribrihabitans marinus]GGH33240.1 acetyltransferase [Cribrihabitans marinus]SEJ82736.1 Acetyltransferase (GNAT) family protein [Cribrihabitans marinus]